MLSSTILFDQMRDSQSTNRSGSFFLPTLMKCPANGLLPAGGLLIRLMVRRLFNLRLIYNFSRFCSNLANFSDRAAFNLYAVVDGASPG